MLKSIGAAVKVATPVTAKVPLTEVFPEKVLFPATVWAVVKSTKFWVAEPVPPFATGKVPVTPVVKGRPVRLVASPEAGVPKIGVTSVGEFDNTTLPVPVEIVTPVPPFTTGSTLAEFAR